MTGSPAKYRKEIEQRIAVIFLVPYKSPLEITYLSFFNIRNNINDSV